MYVCIYAHSNTSFYAIIALLSIARELHPTNMFTCVKRRLLCGLASSASLQYNLFSSCQSNEPKKGTSPRCVYSTFAANNPSEDRFLHRDNGENDDFGIYAVFDGHGGWQVSEFLSIKLNDVLVPRLEGNNDVADSLVDSFKVLEESYINSIRSAYELGFGEVAKVGSCATVAVIKSGTLTVANSGDCRAVLGTELPCNTSGDEKYGGVVSRVGNKCFSASQINRDHNARTPLEQFLLNKDHPGEDNIVVCKNPHACYVKGRLQLTRALGDAYLKYPEFNAPPDCHRSRGRHIPAPYTPPYVQTLPEIHTRKLESGDKFLILATDGLWDFMSPQEAVEVVAACQEEDPAMAAELLVHETLQRAAAEVSKAEGREVTVQDLVALPPGRSRRTKYDDTTAVVVYL